MHPDAASSPRADLRRYLVIALRTARFDASVIEPHRRFLDELRAQNRIELSGAFTDKSGGAYLLLAGSLIEAQAIVARDPLVVTGASSLQVCEWAAT